MSLADDERERAGFHITGRAVDWPASFAINSHARPGFAIPPILLLIAAHVRHPGANANDRTNPPTRRPRSGTGTRRAAAGSPAINRPIAGPTHDKELPVGRHPLQLYSLATPNGVKVTVMLEELLALGHRGAEYDAWLIRIDGNQFGSGFVAVNPNSKIPALMDRSGPKPIRVFESGAILLHLAEKFGALLPSDAAGAGRMPVVAVLADGQRALSRRRLWSLLCLCADQDRIRHRPLRDGGEAPARRARPPPRRPRISGRRAIHHRRYRGVALVWRAWRRACCTAPANSSRCRTTPTCCAGPTAIAKRPAARRGRMVNRTWGDPSSQLHERHDASDFETKTQDKIGEAATES